MTLAKRAAEHTQEFNLDDFLTRQMFWCIETLVAMGYDRSAIERTLDDSIYARDWIAPDDLHFVHDEVGELLMMLRRVQIRYKKAGRRVLFFWGKDIGQRIERVRGNREAEPDRKPPANPLKLAILEADRILTGQMTNLRTNKGRKAKPFKPCDLNFSTTKPRAGSKAQTSGDVRVSPTSEDLWLYLREHPYLIVWSTGVALRFDDKAQLIRYVDTDTARDLKKTNKYSAWGPTVSRYRGGD